MAKYVIPGTSPADSAARSAQSAADAKNNAYRDTRREANAARRAAKARTGNTAGDIAYRGSLNNTYRDKTREANALNASRRPAGGSAPPANPPATNPPPPAGGGSRTGGVPTPPRGTGSSVVGALAAKLMAKPQKPSYAVDMKNAASTKKNTLLKRANAVYGDTRPGADNGEMIQGGASDPKNVTLSGKEFADFKKKFSDSHKSSKGLSDRSLRVMARYMKSRGKGSQFGLPLPPAATPPAEG